MCGLPKGCNSDRQVKMFTLVCMPRVKMACLTTLPGMLKCFNIVGLPNCFRIIWFPLITKVGWLAKGLQNCLAYQRVTTLYLCQRVSKLCGISNGYKNVWQIKG